MWREPAPRIPHRRSIRPLLSASRKLRFGRSAFDTLALQKQRCLVVARRAAGYGGTARGLRAAGTHRARTGIARNRGRRTRIRRRIEIGRLRDLVLAVALDRALHS